MGQVIAPGSLFFLLVSLYWFIVILPEGRADEAWEPSNKAVFFRITRSIWQKYKFIIFSIFQGLELSDSENKVWSSLHVLSSPSLTLLSNYLFISYRFLLNDHKTIDVRPNLIRNFKISKACT